MFCRQSQIRLLDNPLAAFRLRPPFATPSGRRLRGGQSLAEAAVGPTDPPPRMRIAGPILARVLLVFEWMRSSIRRARPIAQRGGCLPQPATGRMPQPATGRMPKPATGRVPKPASGRMPR